MTPWVAAAFALLILGGLLGVLRAAPVTQILWWLLTLAGLAAYALMRAWATRRRVPMIVRLTQSQLSARLANGTLLAEIPYSAIASVQDRFWTDQMIVRGADGVSRVEIPFSTKGVRDLLVDFADLLPPYLWDLDTPRDFSVPFNWGLLGVSGFAAGLIVYFWSAGLFWPAMLSTAVAAVGLVSALLLVRDYQVSRLGVAIRYALGARFVPASQIASVQLKRGRAVGRPLYVSLILHSGKRVALMGADQSAVVMYRTVLELRRNGF